jgi:D-3-phosphoglycerate dehydrogenase
MARVLVSDALSEAGLAKIRSNPEFELEYAPGLKEADLAAKIPGFDALVIRSGSKVTKKVLEAATNLRVVGRAGIGVDNVDVEAASKRGILVMNTPTGNTITTAEHTIALMMSLARKIPQATASMKAGRWEKSKFSGRELAGKTLGVLGLGNIGRIVADRARGLRMQVIVHDPILSPARASQLGVELVELDELFTRSDVITAHTPLTSQTKGIVNDEAIAKMKKGVLLVNCARGGIYDEAALVRGLESGKLGGVALDVFVEEPVSPDHPLLKMDNCIVTPHLGASTEEAQERVALEVVDQVIDYLLHGTIANAVNSPNVTREMAPKLGPYLELARRLGSMVVQVEGIKPRLVEVECLGEPSELGAKAITYAAVAGVLERFVEGPVNPVSAPHVAAEHGVLIRQIDSRRTAKYAHQIAVRVESDQGEAVLVEGALGVDGTTRLTKWQDHELNGELSGTALVIFHEDRPGVAGSVGTILGRHEVNIAQVHLGLHPQRKGVFGMWNVDSAIPPEVLEEVRRAPHVARALTIRLPGR